MKKIFWYKKKRRIRKEKKERNWVYAHLEDRLECNDKKGGTSFKGLMLEEISKQFISCLFYAK